MTKAKPVRATKALARHGTEAVGIAPVRLIVTITKVACNPLAPTGTAIVSG